MSGAGERRTGGCQCGAVRYALHGALGRPTICHCRMCQKAFGSFFGPLVTVPLSAFELTRGNIGVFRSSDLAERGFCRDCGTPLSFQYIGSEKIEISIGSLDDPTDVQPVIQFRTESRLPWFAGLAGLPERESGGAEEANKLERIRRTSRQHPDHDTERWPPEGAP
jgi:hypothetical protein